MGFSNGYDVSKVLAVLRKRVGWNQPYDNAIAVLDEANKASESGRHYEDVHGSVTVTNVKSTQENPLVNDAGLNAVLSSLKDNAITTALSGVFCKPVTVDEPASFFDRLYSSQYAAIPNVNDFVGYRVSVARGNYCAAIHSLELMFDKNATFKIYVYPEFKREAIFEIDVTVTANELTEIPVPNWILTSSKRYYIGYYQADIGGAKALDMDIVNNCFTIIGKQAVSIPVQDDIMDKANFKENSYTYGLNIIMSSYNDYTDSIIRNAHLFDELQALQMAIIVIGRTMYTNRANMDQRIQQDSLNQAAFDMNAETTDQVPVSPGLRSRYSKELKKVTQTFFKCERIIIHTPNP